jgi:hypothetical protein
VSPLVEVVAGIAVVGYVIGKQLRGEPLRQKRVVLLPVVLTVVGALQLGGGAHPVGPLDLALLVPGAVAAIGIGLGQGWMMQLEPRNGTLWGRMPVRSLWLWLALISSRLLLTGLAVALGASAAAATTTILLMLGLNRLGQAAVIVLRAQAAGIPFTPEEPSREGYAGIVDARGSLDRAEAPDHHRKQPTGDPFRADRRRAVPR